MYEGKITGFRDPDVPAEELGMLMAGATDADAAASRHGEGLGAAAETGLMASGLLGIGVHGAGPPGDAAPTDAAPTDTAPTPTGDGDPAGDGGEPG
jgi:hypothetical protein